jgi:multiple sugar transport system substrate-binding protein
MTLTRSRRPALLAIAGLVSAALIVPTAALAQDGETKVIEMWTHSAGNPAELAVYDQIIADFNASQDEYAVEYVAFPQADYNTSIVGASQGGLPCLIDVDGPVTPSWAWAGILQPLDIDAAVEESILESARGYWDGDLYSIGYWDAAVANYARQSVLEANGIRIPTLEEPWTLEEFDAALETLKATGEFDYVWDIGMWDSGGEWYPYAFAPFLQSFGADLIDRETFLTAEGVLNGPEAVAFGEWFQSLFERELVPGPSQSQAEGEAGFINGDYALQWNGNWRGVPTIEAFEANGEDVNDLLFLPAPDFGSGPRIGAASWQWGVTPDCEYPEGANDYIEFSLQPEYLAECSNTIGLFPASEAALELTELYQEGGSLEVFYDLSAAQALIRPPTPGYATMALIFRDALLDIANGADVQTTLDAAVDEIEADIEANNGYGFSE